MRHPLLVLCLLLSLTAACLAQTKWKRVSPFAGVEVERTLLVEFQDKQYELVSIEGLTTDELFTVAANEFGERSALKRIREDIAEVLEAAGKPAGPTVNLVLKDRTTGRVFTFEDAPMTEANRAKIMDPLVESKAGLEQFKQVVQQQWSYLPVSDFDLDAVVAAAQQRLPERVPTSDLRFEFEKIIAMGLDGHATAGGFWPGNGSQYLPALIEPTADRFVLFQSDRSGFVDDEFPYLESIDGVPITQWCDAAAELIPRGSSQYVTRHALRHLRNIQTLRPVLDLPLGDSVEFGLVSEDGTSNKVVTMPLVDGDSYPFYGSWPRTESRLLDGNIVYLRMIDMDERSAEHVRDMLTKFKDTKGLIVDVRDNGGGTREPLFELFSYVATDAESPRVVNAAVYRDFERFDRDHLAARYMYRQDSGEFDAQDGAAIEAFKQSFKPQWNPPEGMYSDWHYLVLKKRVGGDIFNYERPVVVLMNAKCFSATDIFLAGLKGLSNVTLVGQPSGGGSARVQSGRVGDIRLRLGSMVSFQPDGKLFDNNGVMPDVIVAPVPASFIEGGIDNVLQRAQEIIRGKR